MMHRTTGLAALLGAMGLVLAGGCGSDDDADKKGGTGGEGGRPDQTGSACETADDCYPDVADKTTLSGEVQCLDRVRDGYCTHLCDTDDDCCAAEGECKTALKQVCSPFESTGLKMCFLSCEAEDRDADEAEYCQREAGKDFICRSSGGGNQNRKVCVPGDCGVGAECADGTNCDADLSCVTSVPGGYCGKTGCTSNADCPQDSLCVQGDPNYCARPCTTVTDCTFCRRSEVWTACRDTVTFVQDGTTGSVCVP